MINMDKKLKKKIKNVMDWHGVFYNNTIADDIKKVIDEHEKNMSRL